MKTYIGNVTIEQTALTPLTIEEMAIQDQFVEDRIHFYKGTWWKQLRPFFYQPVHPLAKINPTESSPNPLKSFLGYTHLVSDASHSNASSHIMVYKNVNDYSLDKLPTKRRQSVRSAQKKVDVKIVNDLSDLLTDGYEVFKSFYFRTSWGNTNKLKPAIFNSWIEKTFYLRKRVILGAYLKNKLIGYSLSYAIDDIGRVGFIASHSDFLNYRPNDLILHNFLLICKRSLKVTRVLHGVKSPKKGLNAFKRSIGFEEVSYPSYVKVSPIILPLIKRFKNDQYRRLFGK